MAGRAWIPKSAVLGTRRIGSSRKTGWPLLVYSHGVRLRSVALSGHVDKERDG